MFKEKITKIDLLETFHALVIGLLLRKIFDWFSLLFNNIPPVFLYVILPIVGLGYLVLCHFVLFDRLRSKLDRHQNF